MKEKILLGTYTRRKSEGIYSLVLDTKTKRYQGTHQHPPHNTRGRADIKKALIRQQMSDSG